MAPPHTASATNRRTDDLDELFNFLDADTNTRNPQPDEAEEAPVPNRRRLDGDDPLGLGLGIDEEIKVRKARAPIAKLDEERILSDKGIPKLRRITKDRLKFRGKGHEFQDVSRLLSTYQLWLDSLFPKANFADGVAMIEKLGHKKRLQVMRKTWIDEDRPKATYNDDEDFVMGGDDADNMRRSNQDDVTTEGAEGNQAGSNRAQMDTTTTADDVENSEHMGRLRSSSPAMVDDDDLYADGDEENLAASTKKAHKTQPQEPDDDELDALLAEEDASRVVSNKPSLTSRKTPEKYDFEDEEDAMAEMEGMW